MIGYPLLKYDYCDNQVKQDVQLRGTQCFGITLGL